MNPIWRWTVWITSPRLWPVTSFSRNTLGPRVLKEVASCSTELICWSRTPETHSTAVNTQQSFFVLSCSQLYICLWLQLCFLIVPQLCNVYACWNQSSLYLFVWTWPQLFTSLSPFILSSNDQPLSTGKRSSSLPVLSNLCSQRFSHCQIPGPAVCKSELINTITIPLDHKKTCHSGVWWCLKERVSSYSFQP